MATAQTLSPSTEGSGFLQPANTDAMINADEGSFQKPVIEHLPCGHVSAPDAEAGYHAQNLQQGSKQPKIKRRKRRNSFNENANAGGFNQQIGKRRRGNSNSKRQMSASGRIILPTNFLLGGNISDPLNLNSMMDENVNRALNAVTPSSSPLPPRSSVIDIVTPNDVTDPLGLNSSGFTPPAGFNLQRPKGKRKRRRKSHAVRLQEQQNPDTSSNSDDQKGNVNITEGPQANVLNLPAAPSDPAVKRNISQNRKKNRSPGFKGVGHLSIQASQANIRDPIVSPAIPQDTRRFRSSFGPRSRRRRHGTGKPVTSDAGIQTDSNEIPLEEKSRCGSEKIQDRPFLSPAKRRRTVSENLMALSYWDDEDSEKGSVKNLLAEPNILLSSTSLKDVGLLLPKPIGARLEDSADSGKSPAQEYMNKELKFTPRKHPIPSKQKQDGRHFNKQEQQQETKTSDNTWPKHNDRKKHKHPTKKPHEAKFQYGNYNKYYGYRNLEKFKDIRMDCLKKDWFKEKDVLDIGCNAGHLTLLIARDLEPRKIVGIDIDDSLVRVARNNMRHYASGGKSSSKFPASMAISHGPLACPPVETGKDEATAAFPNNVNFFQGNYVPHKDEFLHFQEPEYDVIMCMSVSKWVHLNWGDEGLVRMFKRVFKQLRAGGMFILEPQQWSSYSNKRKICEKLNKNYHSIKIRPDSFPDFLIRDIGFERVDHLNLQKRNKAAGFQRPIQVYYKPE